MTNKIDFINDLLSSTKITVEDKTRILNLAKHELNNFDSDNHSLKERVENIENKINKLVGRKTSGDTPVNKSIKKKHKPKTMIKFLYSFSIDEKFKWFTHNPEGLITEFDYTSYINTAKKNYHDITGWDINNITFYNVGNFIFDNEGKKTNIYNKGDLQLAWKDLKKWCESHPNTHPFSAVINEEKFNKSIDVFKHIIEFRTDDADLTFNIRVRKLIRNLLGVDFNPLFSKSFNEIGQSLNIFSDINLLFNSLEQILKWITKNKSKSNEVEINLIEQDEFYQLEIVHKASYMSSATNNEKLKGNSGDFNKVRKLLFCVADWEIITTLKHNNLKEELKIVCLDSDTKLIDNVLTPNKIEKINTISNTVKHIIKLYKTQNL